MAKWLLMVLLIGWVAGCRENAPTHVGASLHNEPNIRVRIMRHAVQVTVNAEVDITVNRVGADQPAMVLRSVTLAMDAGMWVINGNAVPDIGTATIIIAPVNPNPDFSLLINNDPYPGLIHLVPRSIDDAPADRFDVVNHVHLEAYLPGVLDRELYNDWRLATHHAQAIAARTYALHRILHASPTSTYDVVSTQASQAYVGATRNPMAILGVLETTGLVLSYNDRVIPAYYSSTCGGAGISADDAFGNDEYWPPLEPVARPLCCEQTRHYSWGPIRRDLATLSGGMAAWGERFRHPIRRLGQITDIQISERNSVGRPTRFTIRDDQGNAYMMASDEFRVAANTVATGSLPAGERLKSAFVDVAMQGQTVIITGRGFGHGIGLCQFGAQALAQAGYHADEILQIYYPGAKIDRAY